MSDQRRTSCPTVVALPTRGVEAPMLEYEHPRWSDGEPILVGQDVQVEGAVGFVTSVCVEEVCVMFYGDEGDAIEFAPTDLIRHTDPEDAS